MTDYWPLLALVVLVIAPFAISSLLERRRRAEEKRRSTRRKDRIRF